MSRTHRNGPRIGAALLSKLPDGATIIAPSRHVDGVLYEVAVVVDGEPIWTTRKTKQAAIEWADWKHGDES